MVRALLICCEGKTEKLYFDMLATRIYRIPRYIEIEVIGEKGQHKALVDRTIEIRRRMAAKGGIEEGDIECWAVCDDDGMPFAYSELLRYAEDRTVHLAFSRPQFESYLLQHFEPSKAVKERALFDALSRHKLNAGDSEPYGENTKADLSWLERTLFDKPKLIDIAITNANQRAIQSSSPFLTVQKLTERLRELERK